MLAEIYDWFIEGFDTQRREGAARQVELLALRVGVEKPHHIRRWRAAILAHDVPAEGAICGDLICPVDEAFTNEEKGQRLTTASGRVSKMTKKNACLCCEEARDRAQMIQRELAAAIGVKASHIA